MQRILTLSSGPPLDPGSFSGSLRQLIRAIDARGALLGAVDVDRGRPNSIRAWLRQVQNRRRIRAAPLLARWSESEINKRSRRSGHFLRKAEKATAVLLYGTDFFPERHSGTPRIPIGAALDCTMAQLLRAGVWHFGDLSVREAADCIERQKRVLERCDLVFPRTEWCAQSLVDDYGVPLSRIVVTGGGPNFDDPAPARGGYDGRTILFVGRDWTRKNGQLVLDAFRLARARRNDLRLVIVGVNAELSVPGVEWLGELKGDGRRELSRLYSEASLFVMPSRFEPFGMAILEAMRAGCPPITLDHGGAQEMFESGVHGERLQSAEPRALADAMLRWLADRNRLESAGKAAQAWTARHFTWELAASRIVATFAAFEAPVHSSTESTSPDPTLRSPGASVEQSETSA